MEVGVLTYTAARTPFVLADGCSIVLAPRRLAHAVAVDLEMRSTHSDSVRRAGRKRHHGEIVYALGIGPTITATDEDRDPLGGECTQAAINRVLLALAKLVLTRTITYAQNLHAMLGRNAIEQIDQFPCERRPARLIDKNLSLWRKSRDQLKVHRRLALPRSCL